MKRLLFLPALLAVLSIWAGCEQVTMPTDADLSVLAPESNVSGRTVHGATGDVSVFAGATYVGAHFVAHDNAPPKELDRGSLTVTLQTADRMVTLATGSVNVECIEIDLATKTAWFGGTVLEGATGSWLGLVGKGAAVKVVDNGNSKANRDTWQMWTGESYTKAAACADVIARANPGELIEPVATPLYGGNIQVK